MRPQPADGHREATLRELYRSLDERRRPEDVADLIVRLRGDRLSRRERWLLTAKLRKAHGRELSWFETSMSRDFARPVGAQNQLAVASELFAADADVDASDPGAVADFVARASGEIAKAPGASDFKDDRLNREQRRRAGLGDLSRRQYNKRFRLLARLEAKQRRLEREILRRHFTQVSKSALASRIAWDDFSQDEATAAFIAYYTARCNMRSVFTNESQERPFDVVCEALLKRAAKDGSANWWAIAHVYPDHDVLRRLSDERKGQLLATWLDELHQLADLMRDVWDANDFDAATMIVRRRDDSSSWNALAGAWNRARSHWIALLYALGMEDLLDRMCLGKALRLMAADVVAWHRASGDDLEEDTTVFSRLPFPWVVLAGERACPKDLVERVCRDAGVDPVRKGWIAPRPKGAPTPLRPTPELVHGVVVHSPRLAGTLRKAGWFSGYEERLRDLPDGIVVHRDDLGPLPDRSPDGADRFRLR